MGSQLNRLLQAPPFQQPNAPLSLYPSHLRQLAFAVGPWHLVLLFFFFFVPLLLSSSLLRCSFVHSLLHTLDILGGTPHCSKKTLANNLIHCARAKVRDDALRLLPYQRRPSSFPSSQFTMRIYSRATWILISWGAALAVGLAVDEMPTNNSRFYFDWSPDHFTWGFELPRTTAEPAAGVAADQSPRFRSSIADAGLVENNSSQMMFYWACPELLNGSSLTSALLVDFDSGNTTIAHGDFPGNDGQSHDKNIPYFPGTFCAVVVGRSRTVSRRQPR